MKNFFYLLIAVAALYSCNGGETATTESGSTTAATTDPNTTVTQDPNQTVTVTPDPNAPAVEEPTPGNASFEFEKTEHDFGKVKQDPKVEYTFKFKNTGSEPLVISDARGSCGCTVPNYSKEPIPVGGTGEIQVSFDPKGKSGIQRKTITVTANTNPARTTLNIVSDVEGPADQQGEVAPQ